MNKANKFRARTLSYDQNTNPQQLIRLHSKPNQNYLQNTHKINIDRQKLSSAPKRVLLESQQQHQQALQINQFQIFPLKANPNINNQIFIKTKKANIFHKTKQVSNQKRQQNSYENIEQEKQKQKYQSTFEILKMQIKQLQSSQILRRGYEPNINHFQSTFHQTNDIENELLNSEWIQDFGFISSKQFNSGKNISIVEKNKSKIKKVMKNKKFRNYINKNIQISPGNINEQKMNKTYVSCFSPFQPLSTYPNQAGYKKKQTPSIVKKYYRPVGSSSKSKSKSQYKEPIKVNKLMATSIRSLNFIQKICKQTQEKNRLSVFENDDSLKMKDIFVICI